MATERDVKYVVFYLLDAVLAVIAIGAVVFLLGMLVAPVETFAIIRGVL